MSTQSLPQWFDIGANLGHSSYSDDLPQVLERASDSGVQQMSITGTSIEQSQIASDIASRYPQLCATAGIHPHHAEQYDESTAAALRELHKRECVRAIGETGLDYYRNFAPAEAQIHAFRSQLELAVELRAPVFLHQRDAHRDFIAILGEFRPHLPRAVAHCFTGSMDELEDCLKLDLHIGITGWICDERRGQHLHDVVRHIPPNRLMLETDCPYLLPRTLKPAPKNRRNEPAYLPHIGEVIAEALGTSSTELARQTTATASDFFAA